MTTTNIQNNEIDNELLRQIAAGDQSAFETFYNKYAKHVQRSLDRSFVLNEDSADVTQEVFAQIWRRASSFDPARGNAKAWLMVIARTRALDHLRAKDPVESFEDAQAAETYATSTEPSVGLESIRVRQAIGELPAEYRSILEMAYFEGFSHSQIAALWNRPLGTVKTQIRAGLLRLRMRLENAGPVAA